MEGTGMRTHYENTIRMLAEDAVNYNIVEEGDIDSQVHEAAFIMSQSLIEDIEAEILVVLVEQSVA